MGGSVNIEPIANRSLRVWLSEQELHMWELDSDGVGQRQAVRRLLRQIYRRIKRSPPARLTAELIPVDGGGVLLITPENGYSMADSPWVYRVADADGLLELLRQWRLCTEGTAEPSCCLYQSGEGYNLVVYPTEPLSPRQQHLLWEYGYPIGSGEGAAAHCGEYGELLCAGALLTAPAPTQPDREGLRH